MSTKLLIILLAVVIFSIINLLIKLLGYSFKARKYGIKTQATVIGYYMYYDTKNIRWYPVVKFKKMNGEEVIARSYSLIALPIYKIGETITIKYYANDLTNIEYKEIYIDRFSTKKDQVYIDTNIKFNILDIKHLFDVILEIIIIVVLMIIVLY